MFLKYRDDRGCVAAIEVDDIVRIVVGHPQSAIYHRNGDKIECLRSADTVDMLVEKLNGMKVTELQNAKIENLQRKIEDLRKTIVDYGYCVKARRPCKHRQVKRAYASGSRRSIECK